jgi:hypothetical protein
MTANVVMLATVNGKKRKEMEDVKLYRVLWVLKSSCAVLSGCAKQFMVHEPRCSCNLCLDGLVRPHQSICLMFCATLG